MVNFSITKFNNLREKAAEYLFYLFIFLLPWQTRWIWHQGFLNGGFWEYGSFSLYAVDIILLVIFLLSLFLARRLPPTSRYWRVLLLSLFLICLASVFWSVNKQLSWYAALKLLEGILLVWIILRISFRWRTIGIALAAAGFTQSVLAIWQFFSQRVVANKWLGLAAHEPGVLGDFVVETSGGRFLRAYGSLPHPNMLAGFLVICLVVLVGLLLMRHTEIKLNLGRRIFVIISLVITYYGLILTFSRAAWLTFILLVIFMLIVSLGQREGYRLRVLTGAVLLIILVTALSVMMLPELWQTRTFAASRLETQSMTARAEYFKQGINLLKDNWYQGVGIGSYTQALYNQDSAQEAWAYQPVHNIYLLMAVEVSIFGLMLFLWLMFRFLYTVFWLNRQAMKAQVWFFIYSVSFLGLLIIGLFEHYLWSLSFGLLFFWLVFGLWLRACQE